MSTCTTDEPFFEVNACTYLQMIYSLGNAPAVGLQSRPTLLQRDAVHGSLDLSIKGEEAECGLEHGVRRRRKHGCWYLCDAQLLVHAGSCRAPVVVVVGGIWFGSAGLLHHGFDGCHVGCSVPDRRTAGGP